MSVAELRAFLCDVAPGADLVETIVPLVPELRLWLLNAEYPAGRLSAEALGSLLDSPPYWAFCWGCGAVLARWIFDHPEEVTGRIVLDFGSGSGVVALAAARCGALRVLACDADPRAHVAIAANARLNGVELETVGDYRAVADVADLVLAADVLYDVENLPLLAEFRRRPGVLLADSRVRDFAVAGYEPAGSRRCRVVPDLLEAEAVHRVTVYRATASPAR